ncbi:MAG: M28 family peptidase [Candidatus Hodarchaeota archaeon]
MTKQSTRRSYSDQIDLSNILSSVKELMRYENRIAGTDEIKEASQFINNYLVKLPGIEAWIDKFPIYTSFPLDSEVMVQSPLKKSILSFPNLYSLNTPPEGITSEVIYLGAGGEKAYEGKKVKSKIILADLSYSPPRPEKAWIALKNNAKAIIMSNWGHPENEIVGRGAIKHRWGSLTLNDFEQIPRIPSVNIARKDAEDLKELLRNENVEINLKCKVEDKWVTSNQPMCRIIPSKREFNELLIIGAHLEAWGGTVTDNSTGNAILLEIAKILSRTKFKREVIMAFWDGHEIGEAAGSSWFVDNYWSELNERGLVYLNIDGCGMKGTSDFVSYSSPETYRFLEEIEKNILGQKSKKKLPLKIGDNSFLGIGIPYIFTFTTYTPEELEKLGNAIFGWWYHSEKDTLEQMDEDLLKLQTELYLEYIMRLLNEPIIPLNYEILADHIIQDIKGIQEEFKDIPRKDKLKIITRKIETFKNQVKALHEDAKRFSQKNSEELSKKEKEDINGINKILLSLGRHLNPAFRSASGKYNHDPYGYSVLAKPLPRVYNVLFELNQFDNNCFEHKCLITQLLREYNYLEDAVSNVIYLTHNYK